MLNIQIRIFDPASPNDSVIWKQLNLQWLNGYEHTAGTIPHLLEEADFYSLDHPVKNVIDSGGQIWFASVENKIAGTIGLMHYKNNWEIIKLAVAPEFQGKGIAKKLVETAIDFAKQKGITRLILDTNSSLVSAIRLYEKAGFKHLPASSGKFATADVAMELTL